MAWARVTSASRPHSAQYSAKRKATASSPAASADGQRARQLPAPLFVRAQQVVDAALDDARAGVAGANRRRAVRGRGVGGIRLGHRGDAAPASDAVPPHLTAGAAGRNTLRARPAAHRPRSAAAADPLQCRRCMAQRAPSASVQAAGQRPPTFSGFVVRLLAYLFAGEPRVLARRVCTCTCIRCRQAMAHGGRLDGQPASAPTSSVSGHHHFNRRTRRSRSTTNAPASSCCSCTRCSCSPTPPPWAQRLLGIAIGFSTLTAINIIRARSCSP